MEFEAALRSVALPMIRFGGFAANALLFGLPVIALLVLRPALDGLGAAGSEARTRVGARLEGLVRAGLLGSVVATTLFLVVQATVVSELRGTDIDADAFESIFEVSFGRWHLVRFPLLAGLAILLLGRVASCVTQPQPKKGPRPVWWALWMLLGLGLLATSTFSGHAAVSSPRVAAYANDLIHLASAAVWFSGIVSLALVLPDAWARRRDTPALVVLAPAVDRFARVAFVTIAIVGTTGGLNSFFNIETPNDLIDSGYGRTVASKIVLFVGILALGGINHYFVRKRLTGALVAGRETGARRLFRRTIAAELAIAVSMMALTGLLVGLARTRPSTTGAPASATAPAERA